MNRRELIQSVLSLAVVRNLPHQTPIAYYPAIPGIRGAIEFNRQGGLVRYSIAAHRVDKASQTFVLLDGSEE